MEERRKLYGKYPSMRKLEELGDAYVEVCPSSEFFAQSLTCCFLKWNDGREAVLLRWLYDHPNFPNMHNNPLVICEAMDEFAAQRDFLINIGPDKAEKIAALIAEKKPSVFVELGGYVGYSALFLGNALRNAQKDSHEATSNSVYWSLEADPVFAGIIMNLVDLAGLSDVVKVITGKAADSLTRLKEEGKLETVDMLFLDHVEDLYVTDLQVAESLGLLKMGSHIVADNVLRPGAPEYKQYVKAHESMETRAIMGLIIPGEFEVSNSS
jgi:catechol O-methyltransferase